MKLSVVFTAIFLAIVVAGLVITNPGPEAYADYITEQASTYLSQEVCDELPSGLEGLFSDQCPEIMKRIQPQLASILSDRTERLNIGIASLYSTSFGIPELPFLPVYRAETLGALNQFITYRLTQST